VLTVTKPLRLTHVVICLHGYVKVFKNAVAPGESAEDSGYLGPGRGKRGGEYLGNGFASLFEDEVVLCGDGRLKEGVYKFRFELCFPSHTLPSSIHVTRSFHLSLSPSPFNADNPLPPVRTRYRFLRAHCHLDASHHHLSHLVLRQTDRSSRIC
jgi:hypothetical protein